MINWPPDKPKRREMQHAHHQLVQTLGVIHPQMLDEIKASTRKSIRDLISMFRLDYSLSETGNYCQLTVVYNGVYGDKTVIEKPYGIGSSQHAFEVPLFRQDVGTALSLLFDDHEDGLTALRIIADDLTHTLWDTLEDTASKTKEWWRLPEYEQATKRGHTAISTGQLPQDAEL